MQMLLAQLIMSNCLFLHHPHVFSEDLDNNSLREHRIYRSQGHFVNLMCSIDLNTVAMAIYTVGDTIGQPIS